MKQLPQARLIAVRALFIIALCTHLFIGGILACAPAQQFAASRTARVALLTASQQRDCLVARTTSTTLSLHQSQRRSDSFAAAINSPLTALTFTGRMAHLCDPPTVGAYASLLPAASRAPPSLVA